MRRCGARGGLMYLDNGTPLAIAAEIGNAINLGDFLETGNAQNSGMYIAAGYTEDGYILGDA